MNDTSKQNLLKEIELLKKTLERPETPIHGVDDQWGQFQPLESLLKKTFPETEWLSDRLIPTSSIIFLSAAPGQYKTWVGLHWALSIASGTPAFGQFPCKEPVGTLIVDAENTERRLQRRALLLTENKKLSLYFCVKPMNLEENTTAVDELLKECIERSIRFVIFDSFVRFFPTLDENSSKDTNKAYQQIRKLVDKGISVLFLHHNRKQGIMKTKMSDILGLAESMRGSSDILAMCDVHYAIQTTDRGRFAIIQTKQRDEEILSPFEVEVRHDTEKNTVRFIYSEEVDETKNKREKCAEAVLVQIQDHPEGVDMEHFTAVFNGLFGERMIGEVLKSLEKLSVIYSKRRGDLGIFDSQGKPAQSKIYFSK